MHCNVYVLGSYVWGWKQGSNVTIKFKGSPGLVVMGGDSRSEDCKFKSQHCILDGNFFTLICCKICNFRLKKTENKRKTGGSAQGSIVMLNVETKCSDWLLPVIWLVQTNQGALLQYKWGHVFTWANPGLFLYILVLFKYKFYRKHCMLQQDLNSDRRSRRWARWPLDHHHGPKCGHVYLVEICGLLVWVHMTSMHSVSR